MEEAMKELDLKQVTYSSTAPSISPFMKAPEVAELFDCPISTIYEYARTGLLPAVRIGRQVRFRRSEIESFVESGGQALSEGWRKEQK